jgi:2-oxoglutarate ferredoxin oxidoreductase subunit alpha
MFFGGYPITPASAILHHLVRLKSSASPRFRPRTGNRRDLCGVRHPPSISVSSSSGPGIALRSEAMGLAIMMLPRVIVNSQRGGPSTGLPTKTEQAISTEYGRNGVTRCR